MENEKRLIDANALIAGYDRVHIGEPGKARKLMEDAPTIDAVEVVRCKDCIRRYDTDECPMCFLSGGLYVECTQDDGFCDLGERKDNETD